MAEVPNIVKQRLRTTAEAGAHPDADAIAAFAERSLKQREQTEVLKHLGQCADCREVVALVIAQQPDAAASSVAIARSRWFSWPVLRWGAVAACVVVVGTAVTLHYESLQTIRPAITTPTSDAPVSQSQPALMPSVESANRGAQVAAPAPAEGTRTLEKAKVARESRTEGLTADKDLSAKDLQIIPGRAKDEDELAPSEKLNTAQGAGVANPMMMASSAMIARARVIPANVIPRWTLTPDGMLQRSIDSGKTWETILVATPGTFRALTANGFDIWVGGAKGALYHSIDAGQHWMQVQPLAADEALKADIVGIEFSDLLHGTLTTADQHTWTTADAGQTWTEQ
jgi:hypothetical protein